MWWERKGIKTVSHLLSASCAGSALRKTLDTIVVPAEASQSKKDKGGLDLVPESLLTLRLAPQQADLP